MTTPATPQEKAARIRAACEANWPAHAGDCSGFCRAVAAAIGVPLRGLANDIANTLRSGNGWTVLNGPAAAAQSAADGNFVIAGLRGDEQTRPGAHGHVVVIVDGPTQGDGREPIGDRSAVRGRRTLP